MINDNDVIGAIADIIDGLNTPTERVTIFEGIPNHSDNFPYVSIRPGGWTEVVSDLRDTEVTATYVIACYVNIIEDAMGSQTTLRTLTHDIVALMGDQDNITLGNVVDYSELTVGSYGFDQKEASLYFCEITYTVKKKYNRYS